METEANYVAGDPSLLSYTFGTSLLHLRAVFILGEVQVGPGTRCEIESDKREVNEGKWALYVRSDGFVITKWRGWRYFVERDAADATVRLLKTLLQYNVQNRTEMLFQHR